MADMGGTQVTVAVRNAADPQESWEGLFVVDTGAVDCMVAGQVFNGPGAQTPPKKNRRARRWLGGPLDVTVADVECMGETVGATVIYESDDAEPILGVTALESAGIEVDPRSQRLKR